MTPGIRINGEWVSAAALPRWKQGRSGMEAELADFLEEWYGSAEGVRLQSSGSTGEPKSFDAPKTYLRVSAQASLAAFGLEPGARVLLCLPLRYIAGKMMAVRADVGQLHLLTAEPSSTPLPSPAEEPLDFAALVPMQVNRTLQLPDGRARLENVRTLLLGGGFVDTATEEALASLTNRVYVSYGMTETYSHIALRRVNGAERSACYTPLPGVRVALSAAGTLCLSAPHLGIQEMETQDMAEIAGDGSFRILGRRDAVINSGGIKIQAESIERALATAGITALALPQPDALLGQCVALLWEGRHGEEALQTALAALPRYHRPKHLYHLPELPRTATRKLSRAAAAAWLAEHQEH